MTGKIAFLGPAGSFGHTVAERYFTLDRESMDWVHCIDNAAVVSYVAQGLADWGIIPVENSTEGPVGATLNALYLSWQDGHPVYVYGQAIAQIEHCVIGLQEEASITRVMTHPQAYGQCRDFLARQYGNLLFVPTNSTADAVRLVVENGDPCTIAIGQSRAATIYGAVIRHSGIQDKANNRTRFLVVSNKSDHQPTGHDQTIVMLSCARDTPGSLVEVLTALSGHGISMNMVMSLPGDELGHYRFCFSFAGHKTDPKVACALETMRERSEWMHVFGSFPFSSN